MFYPVVEQIHSLLAMELFSPQCENILTKGSSSFCHEICRFLCKKTKIRELFQFAPVKKRSRKEHIKKVPKKVSKKVTNLLQKLLHSERMDVILTIFRNAEIDKKS